MSFLKKLFKSKVSTDENADKKPKVKLSLDDAFVHHFISKGGKFLYCVSEKEVINNLNQIISENNWEIITCFDKSLKNFLKKSNVKLQEDVDTTKPLFTSCEHLISDNGDILFSSNQLSTHKLTSLTNDFIVFARTSQFVKDTGEGLTGIKTNCKDGSIPTNISAVKKYSLKTDDDNFLNYGNNNSKNLYLLLLEDL